MQDFESHLDWLYWNACTTFDARRRQYQEQYGHATDGQLYHIRFLLDTVRMDEKREQAYLLELTPTLPLYRAVEIIEELNELSEGQERDPARWLKYVFKQKTMI